MLGFVKCDDARADVYGWSGGASAEELTFAALALLHNDGIRHASILLTSDDYYEVADKLDAAVKGSRSTLLHLI